MLHNSQSSVNPDDDTQAVDEHALLASIAKNRPGGHFGSSINQTTNADKEEILKPDFAHLCVFMTIMLLSGCA